MKKFLKKWWNDLKYDRGDPRHLAGGDIKIAVIGGGTGLAVLLRGLKRYSSSISAVVAVTDDGKSSGTIRKDFDILPPGDIRKCISALAYDEKLISNIMEYRFAENKKSFSGHTLGNIWITALTKYVGSFERAIEVTTEIFQTAGKVMPATLRRLQLCAEYVDGKVAVGESKIPKAGKKIRQVYFNHKNVQAYKNAVLAIETADLIIIGPGSLYTSIIPNLLIKSIRKAIHNNTKAVKIFACNSSTERGETENMSIEDHIEAIHEHADRNIFQYVLVNNRILKKSKDASVLGSVNNISTNEKEILGHKIILTDVISLKKPLYHDSDKLAKAIIGLYNKLRSK